MNADSRQSRRSGLGASSGRQGKGPGSREGVPTSREMALEVSLAFEKRGAFVQQALERLFQQFNPEGAERRLATELACSVVRRRRTLDAILTEYCSKPLAELDVTIKQILRLGLNQLLYMDRIPVHSAVDESVNLCRDAGKPGLSGLVNGVLRSVVREAESGAVKVECLQDAGPDILIRPYETLDPPYEGIRIGRPFAPRPQLEPAKYLGTVTSLPQWLVERWILRWSPDAVLRMGLWFDTPGSVGLRVNLLQTTRDKVLGELQRAGISAVPGDLPELIHPEGTLAIDELPGFQQGWVSVQDETAMSVIDLLNPQPGEQILDMCAAPGGKTAHIAERLRDQGVVVACDIVPERLSLVTQAAQRLRLKSIRTQTVDAAGSRFPSGPFDAVLVDVPCSNTGVLGKRPEARWRLEQDTLGELLPVQRRLLQQALSRLRPQGRVLYSTCSIEPEENELLVRSVLQDHPEVKIVAEHLSLPGQPADGGYRALLQMQS